MSEPCKTCNGTNRIERPHIDPKMRVISECPECQRDEKEKVKDE